MDIQVSATNKCLDTYIIYLDQDAKPEDILNLSSDIKKDSSIKNVTVGGRDEPFNQPEAMLCLLKELKPLGVSVAVYTKKTWDELVLREITFRSLLYIDELMVENYPNPYRINIDATMTHNKMITSPF